MEAVSLCCEYMFVCLIFLHYFCFPQHIIYSSDAIHSVLSYIGITHIHPRPCYIVFNGSGRIDVMHSVSPGFTRLYIHNTLISTFPLTCKVTHTPLVFTYTECYFHTCRGFFHLSFHPLFISHLSFENSLQQ